MKIAKKPNLADYEIWRIFLAKLSFWSQEAHKPIFTGFNQNLYFWPLWPLKAGQHLTPSKSPFFAKIFINDVFEMTRI